MLFNQQTTRSHFFIGLFPFLVPLILSISFTNALINYKALTFGYTCNETARCDFNKSLTCQKGVCECRNSDTMVFDQDRSTCVVIANKTCLVEDPVSLTLKTAISLQAPGVRQFSCVKNAYCDLGSKTCNCDELLMPSVNGSCIPKKLFNHSCSSSSSCRQDLGLLCDSGICICNPDTAVLNETQHLCVGQADKPCIKDMCTENAKCVNVEEGMTDLASIQTSYPTSTREDYTKTCQCTEEYDPTPGGSCAKDFGIKCDGVHRCKPWLRCGEGGYCECPYPMGQVYNDEKGACVSMINFPCTSNFTYNYDPENNIICVYGAICVKNSAKDRYLHDSSHFSHHCSCMDSFVENEQHLCDLRYGKECEEDPNIEVTFHCDGVGRTACIDHLCQCAVPKYEYDKKEGLCLGLIGASCSMNEEPLAVLSRMRTIKEDGSAIPTQNWCTKGAKCVPVEEGSLNGTCACVGREIGKGKCSDKNVNVNLIIGISVGAILIGIVVMCCFAYLKRHGLLVNSARE